MIQFNFEGIGTKWQIDIYQDINKTEEALVFNKIKECIEIFDKNYSRFRADSLITIMSKETGIFHLPQDAEPMLSLYYDLYKKTAGLFTPLVGNVLSDAGYDATYSLQQKKDLESPPKWEEVLEYDFPKLRIKKPVLLDFGAGGKGYLIDLVAQVFEENNILEYCIDAGGDILHKNNEPIRIGLENPENTNEVVGVYSLQNASICGSAGNRRTWSHFTHIINPITLNSPTEILAVWVVAKTALIADALATCLFFVPANTLSDLYQFEYLILRRDHSIEKSPNFAAELFTSE